MKVFTNGCFDIIHPGHIDLLERAKELGTKLIVGINSDRSVKAIKGEGRPVQSEDARKAVLLGLKSVDEVVVFSELTPESIIEQIRPDVLVKGGDWKRSEIIGADFVESYGGTVVSLPLKDGYSSSDVVERMKTKRNLTAPPVTSTIGASLDEHVSLFSEMIGDTHAISECAEVILGTFKAGKKILLCGNGGSAADAQHIAAEFVGRYEAERRALPAIALTTDTSALTALANDYDFERIFSRQVDALAVQGDCLIAISTSGNSPNVLAAVMAARKKGCKIVGMTGAKGKKLASLCDAALMVPSERTARVQEAHITVAHIWCEMVEEWLQGSGSQ
jgi:D-sedoheptulose 7-phosphate isomerase